MAGTAPITSAADWRHGAGAWRLFGLFVVVASAGYFVSDLVEATQGGFSTAQLWLTLVVEAAIPAIVLGLAVAHGGRLGRVGWASAWLYAYAYVFFTGTVIYALARNTPDYEALQADLGVSMVLHGALMVIGGLGFGAAVLRAGVLPRWAAVALMLGVVLVAASQSAAPGLQAALAGVRDLGFAGMGLALLRNPALARQAYG